MRLLYLISLLIFFIMPQLSFAADEIPQNGKLGERCKPISNYTSTCDISLECAGPRYKVWLSDNLICKGGKGTLGCATMKGVHGETGDDLCGGGWKCDIEKDICRDAKREVIGNLGDSCDGFGDIMCKQPFECTGSSNNFPHPGGICKAGKNVKGCTTTKGVHGETLNQLCGDTVGSILKCDINTNTCVEPSALSTNFPGLLGFSCDPAKNDKACSGEQVCSFDQKGYICKALGKTTGCATATGVNGETKDRLCATGLKCDTSFNMCVKDSPIEFDQNYFRNGHNIDRGGNVSNPLPIIAEAWLDYNSPATREIEPILSKLERERGITFVIKAHTSHPFNGEKVTSSLDTVDFAKAAECAGMQGENYFMKMHNWIVSSPPSDFKSKSPKQFAADLANEGKFNFHEFERCFYSDSVGLELLNRYTETRKTKGLKEGTEVVLSVIGDDKKWKKITPPFLEESVLKAINEILGTTSEGPKNKTLTLGDEIPKIPRYSLLPNYSNYGHINYNSKLERATHSRRSSDIIILEWINYNSSITQNLDKILEEMFQQGKFSTFIRKLIPWSTDTENLIPSAYSSEELATAVECAATQGQDFFKRMHNWIVFDAKGDLESRDALNNFGKKITNENSNFDFSEFQACLASQEVKNVMKHYANEADNIHGTTLVLISQNDSSKKKQIYLPNYSYSDVSSAIDEFLESQTNLIVNDKKIEKIGGVGKPDLQLDTLDLNSINNKNIVSEGDNRLLLKDSLVSGIIPRISNTGLGSSPKFRVKVNWRRKKATSSANGGVIVYSQFFTAGPLAPNQRVTPSLEISEAILAQLYDAYFKLPAASRIPPKQGKNNVSNFAWLLKNGGVVEIILDDNNRIAEEDEENNTGWKEFKPAKLIRKTEFDKVKTASQKGIVLIKTSENKKIYILYKGRKIEIPNDSVFQSAGYNVNDIKEVPAEILRLLPKIILVKSKKDNKIYSIKNGKRKLLTEKDIVTYMAQQGLKREDIPSVSGAYIDFYKVD